MSYVESQKGAGMKTKSLVAMLSALMLTAVLSTFAPAAQAALPDRGVDAELVSASSSSIYVFFSDNSYQLLECSAEVDERGLDVRSIEWSDFKGRLALVEEKRHIQDCDDLDEFFPDDVKVGLPARPSVPAGPEVPSVPAGPEVEEVDGGDGLDTANISGAVHRTVNVELGNY